MSELLLNVVNALKYDREIGCWAKYLNEQVGFCSVAQESGEK